MDNGISTNGSTNGNGSGLTGASSSGFSFDTGSTNGGAVGTASPGGTSSTSSETFTFPLPRRTPGSYLEAAQNSTDGKSTRSESAYSSGSTHSTEASYNMDTAYKADTEYKATDRAPSHSEPEVPTPAPAPAAASPSTPAYEAMPPTDFDAIARTSMRRKAMGEAAVRIAGRLAHTELLQENTYATDPTSEADHLLSLLGEYLTAAGFERPELHAKLAGQSIVVNLVTPSK